MTVTYNYILDGKIPVPEPDLTKWGVWFEQVEKRRVSQTVIDTDEHVSTVFLGLDHQHGVGPPMLFETMIFGGKCDQYQWRWSTWEQAETGHNRIVEALTNGDNMDEVE